MEESSPSGSLWLRSDCILCMSQAFPATTHDKEGKGGSVSAANNIERGDRPAIGEITR